jgi:transcriptional regulator with XRE-family HTH domain
MEYVIKTNTDIISALRKVRKEKRLTCEVLSGRCGISRTSIHRIENVKTGPKIESLFPMLEALGLEMRLITK